MDFDFKFQSQYIGLWRIEKYPSVELSGTLFVEKQSMWIDLFFKKGNIQLPTFVDSLYGSTYTYDMQQDKEKAIDVNLRNLYFVKFTNLGNGLSHFKYEVKELFIYEGSFEKDDIREISISSSFFDKWNSSILLNAFYDETTEETPDNQHVISFVQPNPYQLSKTDIVNIYFYYGYSWRHGDMGQHIKQKAFLCIRPKDHKSFDEATALVKQYCWLLFLLMNRVFQTDYMVLYTSKGKYIYRLSNKYAYHFLEDFPNAKPHTSLTDFTSEEISSIFSKWNSLYAEYQDAVDSYFETSYNLYLPPSSAIRNYISIIDALSKSLVGDDSEINPKTTKGKTLLSIFEKTEGILSPDEKNRLKTWILHTKGTEIRPRFGKLLEKIKDLIPEYIDKVFVEKAVNTRHNITHPKIYEEYSFNQDEYEEVAYTLTKVIRAYILNELGVKDTMIKKIITF